MVRLRPRPDLPRLQRGDEFASYIGCYQIQMVDRADGCRPHGRGSFLDPESTGASRLARQLVVLLGEP